ncbi:MAG: hypothetical protein JWP18_544 [Solirubrobacterales bacterium]|nr:hypothetical protein [Solirubrobacterales bacterium]
MTLRTRLTLVLAYVTVLAIVALAVPLGLGLRDRVDAEVRSQARGQADLLAVATASTLARPADERGLGPLVVAVARTVHGRVLVVDARGRVLADSGGRTHGADYSARPEIAAALAGRTPQDVRRSASLGLDLLATARPVVQDGLVVGAVRITQSLGDVGSAKSRTLNQLLAVGAVVLLLGLVAGTLLATVTARPLRRLERTARQVAAGDFTARAREEGSAEQRSLARSFNEMTERLGSLVATQQRFVADASHQLRTPLTGLRLRLEAAASPGRGAEARARDLEAATVEVDRLADVVEGLLALSRADEHRATTGTCDLAEAVEDVVDRFSSAAARDDVVLAASVEGHPGAGRCVPADLARALDALVENALAYGSDGGLVEVVAAPGRIEVRDRGPGPAPGEQDEVFDRFHRGSASARAGGTGLGLAIVRALARSWGGEARLERREGGGARAVLLVPEAGPGAPAATLVAQEPA